MTPAVRLAALLRTGSAASNATASAVRPATTPARRLLRCSENDASGLRSCARLRLRQRGARTHEHGDRVEGHVDRDRAPPAVRPGPVPVAAPFPAREVDLAVALADLPHRRHQQVGAEEVLVPEI